MNNRRSRETDFQAGIKLNAWLLPVLVVIFAALYLFTGYRGWLVFFIGSGGAWLLAALWVYSLKRGLSVNRKIHLAWAAAGDSVPELLELKNKSRFPVVWIEIADESDRLVDPVRLVSDVGSQASRRRHPIHLFKKRGLYTLGPTRLRTGDPFGIYTLTLYDQHSNTILITPPQLPLQNLTIAPSGWAGDRQRQRHAIEREISDSGVRNYVPGDSLKRIHWPASAHNDTLIVRQLESAASDDWQIFVDLEEAAQTGVGQDSTLELSIVLAASLAARGFREYRRVGLALAGPKLVWLEPRSDSLHRWQLLRALSEAETGKSSLTSLVSLKPPTHRATWIIITSTTDPAWVGCIRRQHQQRNVMVLLVDPIDFGGSTDQNKVTAVLTHFGIPYARMPGTLLKEAYLSTSRRVQKTPADLVRQQRYMEQGRSSWQRID